MQSILREPALIAGAIRAILLAAVGFGLGWSGEQVALFMAAVEAVLTLVTRGLVTPNAAVDGKIADAKIAARLGVVLLACVLAGTMAACATSHKARVTTAYQTTETALGAFQDAERALYAAQTLPALTEERHAEILQVLVRAFDVQARFGQALLIWRTGEPLPTEIGEWFVEIERVITEVQALDTGGRLPTQLAADVVRWTRAIVDLSRLLNISPPASVAQVAEQGGF